MIFVEIKQKHLQYLIVFPNCNKSLAPTSKSMNIIQNAPE